MDTFPIGGGRMGEAIRKFDWGGTPLGEMDSWPISLRAVIQMMVAQKQSICLFWGPELILLYNDAYAPMLGAREPTALGRPFKAVWSDVWNDVKPFVDSALAGEGTFSEDMRLVMLRNGYEEETFWTFSYSPLYDDDYNVAGLINVTIDTTAAVQARKTQQILQHELMHRVKNSLAVTGSIVSSTLRNAVSVEHARESIERRLAALAEAQSVLTETADSIEIATVIAAAMKPHADLAGRIEIAGPPVRISSHQAVALSLATYELATNASKYGALSVDGGTVSIDWEIDGQNNFRFAWREAGGPAVEEPQRSGFGTRLTGRAVPSYFSGEASTRYDPSGVHYVLTGTLPPQGPARSGL